MMRFVAPVLVLLSFTDPHGLAVWIERNEVSTVHKSVTCEAPAATMITTLSGPVCVREPPDEVVVILEKHHDSTGRFRSLSGD